MNGNVRPIPSAPGYFATAEGQIIGKRGGIMQPWAPASGYFQVCIWRGAKRHSERVNRLVCEAFHGAAPSPEHHAAHNDGCKTNNVPSNLRWAICKDNFADRRRHGTWPQGENNGQATLTDEQALAIFQAYRLRMGRKIVKPGTRLELAEKFGVSVAVIRDIASGRHWKQATGASS